MIPHRTGWLYQLSEFESKGALGAASAFEMRIREHASPVSVVLSLEGEDPRIVSGPLHLHQPLRMGGVRRPAGTKVDVDAIFETENEAQILAVRLGPSDNMLPPLRALFSNRPLEPGRAYRVFQTETPVVQKSVYANLAAFAKGTRLLTRNGARAIEDVRPRDQIFTLDHGMRPVVGIGRRSLTGPDQTCVRIRKGTFGAGRDLVLAPHHRVVKQDPRSAKYFGEQEVLVTAQSLVDGVNVLLESIDNTAFYYVLFDRHEIVMAEGLQVESTLISSDAALVGEGAEDLMQVMPGFLTNAPSQMTCARAISL